MKAAALCAGFGGLELGLHLAGWPVELAWVAETDPHASTVLDARFAVPNLGDLTKITDPPPVDLIAAGFPCQPVSTAGRRKGIHDQRWLIDDVCQVARRSGARWLILENVAGLLSANGGDAMARVIAALAATGFAAEWGCLRAADVGAPHGRLRWFCVAHTGDDGSHRKTDDARRGKSDAPRSVGRDLEAGCGTSWTAAPDPDGGAAGRDGRSVPSPETSDDGWGDLRPRVRRATAPDAEHDGQHGHPLGRSSSEGQDEGRVLQPQRRHPSPFGPYAPAVDRWAAIIGRPTPPPTDDRRRLSPRFVEWMMGLPDGWVTDVVPQRSHALRILGNGVVPQQAAAAVRLLTAEVTR